MRYYTTLLYPCCFVACSGRSLGSTGLPVTGSDRSLTDPDGREYSRWRAVAIRTLSGAP